MKAKYLLFLTPLLAFTVALAMNSNPEISDATPGINRLLENAISEDAEVSANAIAKLREKGSSSVEAFMDKYQTEFETKSREENKNLHAALDQIAGQRDAYYSKLFWHTDLEKAKKVSALEGKPILSLRMLGNLTDEYSCANSRLFRSVLYPNAQVSSYLQDHYVLHWSSERPVPVVSIDMGDGRMMKTTLTGNSIHYVLDETGLPIDAIPGLNSPDYFKSSLEKAEVLFDSLAGKSVEQRKAVVQAHHGDRLIKMKTNAGKYGIPVVKDRTFVMSNIFLAERLTVGKGMAELPTLDAIGLAKMPLRAQIANPFVSEDENTRNLRSYGTALGVLGKIDTNSREMIVAKNPEKYSDVKQMQILEAQLIGMLQLETAKNEIESHAYIHLWMSQGGDAFHWAKLNERVYGELFLTPASDEWLGLRPEGVFTALEGDGILN